MNRTENWFQIVTHRKGPPGRCSGPDRAARPSVLQAWQSALRRSRAMQPQQQTPVAAASAALSPQSQDVSCGFTTRNCDHGPDIFSPQYKR